jgi:hypothetical protein
MLCACPRYGSDRVGPLCNHLILGSPCYHQLDRRPPRQKFSTIHKILQADLFDVRVQSITTTLSVRWPSWLWRQVKVTLAPTSWYGNVRGFKSHSHHFPQIQSGISFLHFFQAHFCRQVIFDWSSSRTWCGFCFYCIFHKPLCGEPVVQLSRLLKWTNRRSRWGKGGVGDYAVQRSTWSILWLVYYWCKWK